MNAEIVKELVRVWRTRAEPEPVTATKREYDKNDTVHISVFEMQQDEIAQKIFKECAQDLEDVIRIYHEFKYKK